jgi:indolepyruvate ferredoxin oxidoreductase beta subunit
MNYDIYLVGVGGQGVLTIADLVAQAALQAGVAANYYPTKGMAQRGGFVKAQVRLGRTMVGPQIPEKGADLVIAMELSEALKAVRYIRPGGDFLLFGHVWQPTAVLLGKAPYPARDQVEEQIRVAGARLCYLDPEGVPLLEGTRAGQRLCIRRGGGTYRAGARVGCYGRGASGRDPLAARGRPQQAGLCGRGGCRVAYYGYKLTGPVLPARCGAGRFDDRGEARLPDHTAAPAGWLYAYLCREPQSQRGGWHPRL